VYGVISFGVTRQRREFGIRLALGASRQSIASTVVSRGVLLAAAGVGTGLVLSVAMARTMRSMLFGVTAGDPASFIAAAATILVIAVVASYVPARRTARVDPALTVRAE
jgi:putative ABC transport system permease protein